MIFCIKRLPTRDIRENLDCIRKKLWSITIFSIFKFVVLKASKNYEAIYYKHIIGSRSCENSQLCTASHLIDLPLLRLSIITWQGTEATEIIKKLKNKEKLKLINNTLNYLYRLNNQNQKIVDENLQKYRYLNLFINSPSKLNKEETIKKKIYKQINELSPGFVGCGIEDPVLSAFTIFKNELCLVDLDNFSKTINFFYEVGFLLADLEIDHKFKQVELKKLWELYQIEKGIILKKDDRTRLLLGYISRYAILFINIRNNVRFNYEFDNNKALRHIYYSLNGVFY